MKRHVQEPGIKRWYGPDLIDLQAEPMKAIDGLLKPYESCVLSGCEISGTTTKSIAPGLILFTWQNGSVKESVVAEFVGATGLASSFTRWLRLEEETITREYETGGAKPIAIYKKAILSASQPAEPFVIITQNGPQKTFRDAIQTANYRFVSDSEKSQWNAKLDASEVSGSASPNKVLRLNASSQFPASVIAQTSSLRFVTDAEKNTWNAKASTDVATTLANGLMSSIDKSKLNGIADNANNYSHPSTHPHTMITGLGTAATKNTGISAGNVLEVGGFGWGGLAPTRITTSLNNYVSGGFTAVEVTTGTNAPAPFVTVLTLPWDNTTGAAQIAATIGGSGLYFRGRSGSVWQGWNMIYHTGNFEDKSSEWNQAFSWGNHSQAGYLTSLPAHNHSAANITSGTLSDARLPATMSSKTFSGPITVGNSSFVAHLSFVRNGTNVIHANGGSTAAIGIITGNKAIATENFALFISHNNRVAINKSAALYDLDVSGNIRATGNVLADSDFRLKQNIMQIKDALSKVSSLKGVSFEWKKDGAKSIGLIAQDVQKIIPEAVKIADDGIMSVDYGILVGLLVEAIKELTLKLSYHE